MRKLTDIREHGPNPPERHDSDDLWLWLVLCVVVFACIMVNYLTGIQVGVE